ncbi:MAG: Xaa-Pro peptidase family protein [Chloroflexi bacterium]|nr:Xaa-Pro peptidase family protein [Chloroflexota bacterium]
MNRVPWPEPADFAAPPTRDVLLGWLEADRGAWPARLGRLRERMEQEGVDGYFGVRWEHMRYLTGMVIHENEVNSAGDSGKFLVTADRTYVLADSRYTVQAARLAPDSTVFECYNALPARWPDLVNEAGVTRVAVEAGFVPQTTWTRLQGAVPEVELVPVEGWVEELRQTKEPSELERVAAACAIADRALAALLPVIKPGMTEHDLALDLEWRIRTGGAESLAFDVACLAGPEAALPHGHPRRVPIETGQVLLFDFGAQVAGYRSDMTRTLFVGEPNERDLAVYEQVANAQEAAYVALREGLAAAKHGAPLPTGPEIHAAVRAEIEADGRWAPFGHGLGHGIGLATHELPTLGARGATTPLPTPTVFSIEPGIYLESETGVRIEDLVVLDAPGGRFERITNFPAEIVVVGA